MFIFTLGKFEWIDQEFSPKAINIILNYGFNTLNLNKLWAEIYEIDSKNLTFLNPKDFKLMQLYGTLFL